MMPIKTYLLILVIVLECTCGPKLPKMDEPPLVDLYASAFLGVQKVGSIPIFKPQFKKESAAKNKSNQEVEELSPAATKCLGNVNNVFNGCTSLKTCFEIAFFQIVYHELQNDEAKLYFEYLQTLIIIDEKKQKREQSKQYCKDKADLSVGAWIERNSQLFEEDIKKLMKMHNCSEDAAKDKALENIQANADHREKQNQYDNMIKECLGEMKLNGLYNNKNGFKDVVTFTNNNALNELTKKYNHIRYVINFKKTEFFFGIPNTGYVLEYLMFLYNRIDLKNNGKIPIKWCQEIAETSILDTLV